MCYRAYTPTQISFYNKIITGWLVVVDEATQSSEPSLWWIMTTAKRELHMTNVCVYTIVHSRSMLLSIILQDI